MTEVTTQSDVRHVDLTPYGAPGQTLALITLDNGAGPTRPNTLSLSGLALLRDCLLSVLEQVQRDKVHALAVTGTPTSFAAGADLHAASSISTAEQAQAIADAGHQTFKLLLDCPVPTFAFISGAALGGGMELAASCRFRTAAESVRHLGLPEVALGLVPGWGGTYLLPGIVGIEKALTIIVDNPLRNNKHLNAADAVAAGLVDKALPDEGFLGHSLHWASSVLTRKVVLERPAPATAAAWQDAIAQARSAVDARLHQSAPAAYEALNLLALSQTRDRKACFDAEDAALVRLLLSDEFASSMYAFDLTTRRAKRSPEGINLDEARPIQAIAIAGAGLMASQLALLCARELHIPVTMRDLDQERADHGLALVQKQLAQLSRSGRLPAPEADAISARISATTDVSALADSDLVIEAVFEDLTVKQQVFAELEGVLHPAAILATNTSALSVSSMAAALTHPERVVGLHFFNPVAQMPLVEVVRTPHTDDVSYATAFALARACRKIAIAVTDRPGFIVNRLLLRLLGDVLASLEAGTEITTAEHALDPMGLPMGPFQLLHLVGPAVAKHVLDSLRANLGDRYPASPGLDAIITAGVDIIIRPNGSGPGQVNPAIASFFSPRSPRPLSAAELLHRVLRGLAQEVDLMLAEQVVSGVEDVDLAMILGAGWPFHLGGITPYLKRTLR